MKVTVSIILAALGTVLALPLLYFGGLLVWFFVVNFPFTSGMVAYASAPSGEEFCVVETFKSAEPYQVSLYARRSGQPWAWNYLAHQDTRWRSCRVEIAGDTIRIFRGSTLVRELPVTVATDPAAHPADSLPPTYSPEQIVTEHNRRFRL